MNATGTAVGESYYNPVKGFSFSEPAVVSTGGTLSIIQPQCTTNVAGCTYYPYSAVGEMSLLRAVNNGGT